MTIFPKLDTESVVQIGDKTRLSAEHSFVSDGSLITMIEIKPSALVDYIAVSVDRPWLDWIYTAAGDITASVRVTVGTSPNTVSNVGETDLEVVSVEDDDLFSSDADLIDIEPSIKSLLSDGRATFIAQAREAKRQIMGALNERVTNAGWFESTALSEKRYVREWSKYLTLSIIFGGTINAKDDFFADKAAAYAKRASQAEANAYIELNLTKSDGSTETTDVSFGSIPVVRR